MVLLIEGIKCGGVITYIRQVTLYKHSLLICIKSNGVTKSARHNMTTGIMEE